MTSSLQHMAAGITERSKTLINNDLKKICKEEGTSQTGNKAALQARVVGRKCSRLRFPFTHGRCFSSLSPYADFTLTSHHQCCLQERRRGSAEAAVPRTKPRRRTLSRDQQQSRRAFLRPALCSSFKRLQHDQRLSEQRSVSAVSSATDAVPYAHRPSSHRPGTQLMVTRTPVLLQG